MESRRLKIASVDPQMAMDAFNWMRTPTEFVVRIISELIPEDAQVVGIRENWNCQCIDMILAHDSFDEVGPGEKIPRFPGYYEVERKVIHLDLSRMPKYDDDYAATPEWLIEQWFEHYTAEYEQQHRYFRGPLTLTLQYKEADINPNCPEFRFWFNDKESHSVRTRRDVRDLCIAFKIPLKENEPDETTDVPGTTKPGLSHRRFH